MALYSSRSKKSFLEGSINVLPDDAYPITAEQHQAYLQGQTDGQVIDFSTEPPSLIDRASPTPEQLAATERKWRDIQLLNTDQHVARHRDEVDDGGATTLTAAQLAELQTYRRELRAWPEAADFPDIKSRPVAPTKEAPEVTPEVVRG